jgi:sterol desaturase/sphingolipid hydroxylase (fatty acid hydroxylase superfamily)
MTSIAVLAAFVTALIALRIGSTYVWTLHRRHHNDPTPRPVLRFLETMRQYLANESAEGEEEP